MILNLYRHRNYIVRNAWSDLRLRYAGSGMGIFWNVIIPLAQILIYTVVFSRLMSFRSPGMASNRYAFVLYLCSGLFPWIAFSRSITRGSNALLVNARHLKMLPIPEEIFVAQSAMADTFSLLIYLVLLVVAGLLVGQPLGWPSLLLPLVAVLFQGLAFGIGLLLSSLRVFFRDIGQALGIATQLWMWTLPIIYVESILPENLQSLLTFNPPYIYITSFRDLFLHNRIPPLATWGGMVAWAAGFALLGSIVLHKLRPELRDAL